LVIDGNVNKQSWRDAPWTDDFVDIEGDKKPVPRYSTRAKMLWDEEYLYIGAELQEPHVWATLTKRDSVIFQDNDFEVFIDPNGDNHQYYEFEINALNTGWDLRLPKPYKDGGSAIDTWDIKGIKTAVRVHGTLNDSSDVDEGWSVEIAMPWDSLSEFAGCVCPPKTGDQWRINFSRVQWHVDVLEGKYVKRPKTPEDNWVWSPQGVIDMHRPERWGYVQFVGSDNLEANFRYDETWDARERLHGVYYAQRAFFERHKKYASDLSELGVSDRGISMVVTPDGYSAHLSLKGRGERDTIVEIREDSLITIRSE